METLTTKRSMSDYPLSWWSLGNPYLIKVEGRFISNWFSNMSTVMGGIRGLDDGILYPSVENYFQAHKSLELDTRLQMASVNPYKAKQMGKKITIHPDWNDGLDIMFEALSLKWNKPFWKDRLHATKDTPIIEWNNWRDDKWGVSIQLPPSVGNYQGRNILGLMLMEIRDAS